MLGPSDPTYQAADEDSGSTEAWEGCSSGRESPPPAWDAEPAQVESFPPPGDLSELSLQTETFAQKHGGSSRGLLPSPATATAMVTPSLDTASRSSVLGPLVGGSSTSESAGILPLLGNSGRRPLSSYSSIVSSSSGSTNNTGGIAGNDGSSTSSGGNMMLGAEITARRGPALPSTSPELPSGLGFPGDQDTLGRPAAASFGPGGFGPFSDSSLQGIMHGGMSQPCQPPSAWSTGLPPIGGLSPNYGMHPTAELPGFGAQPNRPMDPFLYGNNAFSADASGLYGSSMYSNRPDQLNQPQMTMMQQLQVERRQRLYEHQQKVKKGEDWPGFSTTPMRSDSLWDPDCKPMERHTWANNPDATPGGTGFWNTLTNSASSGWSSLQSLANIWGSNNSSTSAGGDIDGAVLGKDRQLPPGQVGPGFSTAALGARAGQLSGQATDGQQLSGSTPPFNPFTSMADIWSPTSLANDNLNSVGGARSSSEWNPIGSGGIHGPVNPPTSKEDK
ncbi:transmembrane protein 131-like isoform X4 [Elysia marginata]|uniref:Transmembrane protein 131-like isoform X4 n=1 Tax=Elysia marginata TaxID=1093978 RepID=A0AAV4FK04_9GAST|nr:transmembrane protein 131-like isoform X4 [Elysia marginata]